MYRREFLPLADLLHRIGDVSAKQLTAYSAIRSYTCVSRLRPLQPSSFPPPPSISQSTLSSLYLLPLRFQHYHHHHYYHAVRPPPALAARAPVPGLRKLQLRGRPGRRHLRFSRAEGLPLRYASACSGPRSGEDAPSLVGEYVLTWWWWVVDRL